CESPFCRLSKDSRTDLHSPPEFGSQSGVTLSPHGETRPRYGTCIATDRSCLHLRARPCRAPPRDVHEARTPVVASPDRGRSAARDCMLARSGGTLPRTLIHCRPAEVRDVDAIAALHADSWRRNYRGAYLDSYLDGDVVTDRLVVWCERITRPDASFRSIVAEHDGAFAGFAHTMLDDDPRWGALLENLHVAHELKGRGIGTRLMAASARAVLDSTPGAGLYLWVLD